MNLDELRAVRDDERASGELQPLRPSFYADARAFIAEIEAERDRQFAAADDPHSDSDVAQLNDKLSSARGVLDSIFDNRASKLLTRALTVAAGETAEPPDMTAEEGELYRVVVGVIRSTKAAAIDGNGGDALEFPEIDRNPAAGQSPSAPDPPPDDDGATADEPPDAESRLEGDPGGDRLLVRVVDDVGTILGVDEREYELATGDVVSLPVENARALLEREVATQVEID